MRVIVKARHMTLTSSLKDYVQAKLGRPISRRMDRPALKMEVELSELSGVSSGEDKECRVRLVMPRGRTINIVEIADDMYKAIDLAHDRLLLQVKRERGRTRDTTRGKKRAAARRAKTAEHQLTGEHEMWEFELEQFEQSASA